jgi:hypothetical protein
MPSTIIDDLAALEPRLAEVAHLLKDIRDNPAVRFTAKIDIEVYEHLHELLKQATR